MYRVSLTFVMHAIVLSYCNMIAIHDWQFLNFPIYQFRWLPHSIRSYQTVLLPKHRQVHSQLNQFVCIGSEKKEIYLTHNINNEDGS